MVTDDLANATRLGVRGTQGDIPLPDRGLLERGAVPLNFGGVSPSVSKEEL